MQIQFLRACFASALVVSMWSPVHAQAFVNFESPSIHPISVSSDGNRLLVVNTPDNRLAIYSLAQPGPSV